MQSREETIEYIKKGIEDLKLKIEGGKEEPTPTPKPALKNQEPTREELRQFNQFNQ